MCFISDQEVTNVWYEGVFSYLAHTHNRIAETVEPAAHRIAFL